MDYLCVRADGRAELHIHAEITTDDGTRIAVAAGGVAVSEPGSAILQLRENVTLASSYPELRWVNPLQLWAHGTFNAATRQVHVMAYAV